MALDTQTNLDKEINEEYPAYLGIDPTDIDFDTYRTLLKEKIFAARIAGDAIWIVVTYHILAMNIVELRRYRFLKVEKKKD